MSNLRYSGLAILFAVYLLSGCSTELVTGMDENEANRILVVLSENNIRAKKILIETDQGPSWNVYVNRQEFLRALQVLKENNLPGEKVKGVLEIFAKKDFLPTQTAEKALREYSQNAELSKTLEQIQGVVRARVHIARERDELTGVEKPVSASVLINYIVNDSGTQLFSIEDIRKIIAGGVANLLENNVNVVAVPVPQKSVKPSRTVSPVSFAFFLSCGIFVLIAGGINLYLWKKFRVPMSLNNRGINAVPDKRETEKEN